MKLSHLVTRAILSFLFVPFAFGQYYYISTVAGNGPVQFAGAGGPAINVSLVSPRHLTADAAGNFFFSDEYFNQVFRVGLDGVITVVAGNGTRGFSGDNGPATSAQLDAPAGLAVDAGGNLYIADGGNARIRRVAGGTITTFAGDGRASIEGDNGPAASAGLGGPSGLVFDRTGNLYVSQPSQHVVRMIRTDGTIVRVAGTGTSGFSGDGGPATAATLFGPIGMAVDSTGNLLIADTQNHRIRRVAGGVINTHAGNGQTTLAGDGGLAVAAALASPFTVALDATDNLYIADAAHARVRLVTPGGMISSFAGAGTLFTDGPGNQTFFPGLSGMVLDNRGGLIVVASAARQVRRVLLADQTVRTVAGVLPTATLGDNVAATSSPLLDPFSVAVDPSGNLYIADSTDHRVRKVSPTGTITTFAGTGIFAASGDGAQATQAAVGSPRGVSVDPNGNLIITSGFGAGVRRIATNGTISTVAGGGGPGSSGDGGLATRALFLGPISAVADAAGNTFVSDRGNNVIRRVDAASGIIGTIAGSGTAGFGGDNGLAGASQLNSPRQLALDSQGNLFIADTSNNRIRKIGTNNIITTVAGSGATTGGAGDGGPAAAARVSVPTGVAVDTSGNLYIATGAIIRKVDASTGIISRIAGTGVGGFSGDGGLATNAMLDAPQAIAVDRQGNVFIADENNFRVRKLTPLQIVPEGTVNGATQRAGGVAPGEIATIYGFNLGPSTPAFLRLDASGKVATELGGTQVFFDNRPAPMLYSSANQVNFVVPYGVSGTTQVRVVFQGTATNTITLTVVASSPGIFAITNQDGSVNSASNRAEQGSILIIYGTGEGQTDPGGVDGAVSTSVFPKPVLPVTVTVGGQPATVLYAGAAPGFVSGVLQMNIQLPAGVTGVVPLVIKIGDASLPAGANVSIR